MRLYTLEGDEVEIPEDALNMVPIGSPASDEQKAARAAEDSKLRAFERREQLEGIVAEHNIRGVTLEDLPADMEITPESVRTVVDARDGEVARTLGFASVDDYRDMHARLARGERPAPPAPPAWMTESREDKADKAYREALERRMAPDAARAEYIDAMMRS